MCNLQVAPKQKKNPSPSWQPKTQAPPPLFCLHSLFYPSPLSSRPPYARPNRSAERRISIPPCHRARARRSLLCLLTVRKIPPPLSVFASPAAVAPSTHVTPSAPLLECGQEYSFAVLRSPLGTLSSSPSLMMSVRLSAEILPQPRPTPPHHSTMSQTSFFPSFAS